MNYVYLIGNGFDLAHGLPTSYNDFLFDYLLTTHRHAINNWNRYEDDLLLIDRFRWPNFKHHFTSIEAINSFRNSNPYEFKEKHSFFKNLLSNYENKRWVDIEYEYYLELLKFYFWLDKTKLRRDDNNSIGLADLNKCFGAIKKALISYLTGIDFTKVEKQRAITEHLHDADFKGKSLFLNFNYTSTLRKYNMDGGNSIVINIHGTLDSPEQQQIFGYGDEMDSNYSKIEELNDNEFLKHFKSFGYLRTTHYQQIEGFLGEPFEVRVMGHSCGISDRVLLNQIFQARKCERIRIYYYQRPNGTNDHFEKTMEISRHFDPQFKAVMRKKVIAESECQALVPVTK